MKSLINHDKKDINSNKFRNHKRHSSIDIDSNNKISHILINKGISSLFRTNKTIQKYINEKLSLLSSNIQPNKISKELSRNINNNILTKKNNSFNKYITNKSSKTSKNKTIKGRNIRHENQLIKNEFMTNQFNYRCNKLHNILENTKLKGKQNLKKKINQKITNLINNKENIQKTKGKLVKEFYQNYSSSLSMSTGISLNPNNEIIYKENKIKDNNTINSNNNYEIDSIEEDNIHEIIFKGINNGSPITFGNSFSYTNSKRSTNSNNKEKNEEKIKIDKNILLLKCQNETLKKELKQSNQQITFLKNEIEKLIKNKKMNITNYKYNVNLKNKKIEIKPKIFSKNSSYLDNFDYDIDKSHYNSDARIVKKFSNNSCNYKMKFLNKNKNKNKINEEDKSK